MPNINMLVMWGIALILFGLGRGWVVGMDETYWLYVVGGVLLIALDMIGILQRQVRDLQTQVAQIPTTTPSDHT